MTVAIKIETSGLLGL